MNAQEYAVFYATQKNWSVFPLKPHDKKPLFPAAHEPGSKCHGECGQVGHGFHDATKDVFTIAEWWSKYPDAGVGIATGDVSDFFALDIDPIHNGEETYRKHVETYGELPKTITALTGSGGHHYLFKMPKMDVKNSAGKLGAGIDTRGNGGYIATAPTIHPNGTPYKWIEPPSKTVLAESPEWILQMLFANKEQQITTNPTDGAYISGQRNTALTSLAGSMRRRNMTEDAIFLALNAENLNRCVPPLLEAEVRALVSSVMRYDATAAMPMSNKDRVQAEWGLVKSVYEWPNIANEFTDIKPLDFGQKELGDFWSAVQAGIDVTAAANNCGIMAELEKAQDYQVGRVEGYVKAIKHYSYHASMIKLADTLKHHASAGNNHGVDKVLTDINRVPSQSETRIISISDTADEVEKKIKERAANPTDVWGIPYAWDKISSITGGKQPGEIIVGAGEPGVGKSWWWLQDTLETAINHDIPIKYWSGEMKRYQIMMRFYQLLGVDGWKMKSGNMTKEDWQALAEAKALVMNSPIYIDDKQLGLNEIRPMLVKEKAEFGIQQVVFDYASLIVAPGKDETEQSANVSRTMKQIAQELDLSIILISSVNKGGMDQEAAYTSKSNLRGSGQIIHDADVIYFLTKFDESKGMEYGIRIDDYKKTVLLNIMKGRELVNVENGFIPYTRIGTTPKFQEIVKPERKARSIS